MSKNSQKLVTSLVGFLALAASEVSFAAPLVPISILGSTNGGSTYSSNLTVTPGQTVNFEVLGQLAAVGTNNTHSTSNITSIVPGTDGINSLAFNLIDSDSGTYNVASLTLGSGWNGGSGFGVGTVNGNTLVDVRPIQAPGVFVGASSPVTILTGTFVAGSFATFTNETLTGSWATTGTTSGAFKINGGSSKVITTTTETSTDPYASFSGLTLTVAPEPGSITLLGISTVGLLLRRRRV